jgi:hypothetical protein
MAAILSVETEAHYRVYGLLIGHTMILSDADHSPSTAVDDSIGITHFDLRSDWQG